MMRVLSLAWMLLLASAIALPAPRVWADDEPAAEKSEEDKKESSDKKNDDKKDDDKKDKPAKEEKKKERKTATVEQKPLKVEVTMDGTFVARNMAPIELRPEAWGSFEIEEVVPHGATVRAGETLVKFDDEKLADAIADLELSQRISGLSLRKAEQELPRMEKSLEMDLVDATQSHQRSSEDYQRYKDEDREEIIASLKMSLKSSKQRLDYAKDELDQLEKMYKADDLTEETEEIILTRSRQQYEMQKFYYEQTKDRIDEMLTISLPRQDEDNSEIMDRIDMSLERAKLSSQLDLNRARYELEKMRVSNEKSLDRHAKLIQDRGLMTIKAPMAGIVYYGSCTDGKWGDMASMQKKLLPHNSVSSGTTMMTIVDPAELYLVGTIGEKELPTVESGQTAEVTPTGEGADELGGEVASVTAVPVSPGKHAVEVSLASDDKPEWLMPGMSGKIKITTYHNKKALLLNKKAVHTDEDDEDEKYVWLVTEEDGEEEVEKQQVKPGKTKGDLVEILGGLDKGDKVSLEDEKEEDDDDEDED